MTDRWSTPDQAPSEIDTSVAHSARVWNYFLGGKDYFPADQEAAEMALALMLLGIVNFIVDDQQAHAIVNRLLAALPAGSYLAMTHPTQEVHGEEVEEAMRQWNPVEVAEYCAVGRKL